MFDGRATSVKNCFGLDDHARRHRAVISNIYVQGNLRMRQTGSDETITNESAYNLSQGCLLMRQTDSIQASAQTGA